MNNADYHLQQFNETTDWWIACLDDYTLPMLIQKPGDGSWAIGQFYTHIISDTHFFIGQMKLALADTENHTKQMRGDAAEILGNNDFPDIRISNPAASQPQQPHDKNEIIIGLTAIKREMREICLVNNLDKSMGKSLHPGLLYFNAIEWLQLAEIHMRHHFRQKKRIDDALFQK
jgi:hypothetical protein